MCSLKDDLQKQKFDWVVTDGVIKSGNQLEVV